MKLEAFKPFGETCEGNSITNVVLEIWWLWKFEFPFFSLSSKNLHGSSFSSQGLCAQDLLSEATVVFINTNTNQKYYFPLVLFDDPEFLAPPNVYIHISSCLLWHVQYILSLFFSSLFSPHFTITLPTLYFMTFEDHHTESLSPTQLPTPSCTCLKFVFNFILVLSNLSHFVLSRNYTKCLECTYVYMYASMYNHTAFPHTFPFPIQFPLDGIPYFPVIS